MLRRDAVGIGYCSGGNRRIGQQGLAVGFEEQVDTVPGARIFDDPVAQLAPAGPAHHLIEPARDGDHLRLDVGILQKVNQRALALEVLIESGARRAGGARNLIDRHGAKAVPPQQLYRGRFQAGARVALELLAQRGRRAAGWRPAGAAVAGCCEVLSSAPA